MLLVMLATVVLTVQLYRTVPKGFMPIQDTGILMGSTSRLARHFVQGDGGAPARRGGCAAGRPGGGDGGDRRSASASGWSSLNRGQLTVSLKPLAPSAYLVGRR